VSTGLLTYKTDLKSLKFGKDRPFGGDSNQPYIKSSIPSNDESISGNLGDKDFILRGGIGAPLDALDDVIRLGKYFTDLKSISGPLFIAKQNILSRISPATQASGNQSSNNKWQKSALNEGIYTPLSTLVQAGIGFLGGHVDKQGINLIRGIRTYSDVASLVIGSPSGGGNRLVDLFNTDRGVFKGPNIFSYSGGPNSTIGIGKTHIQFAKDNQGGVLRVLDNKPYTESYIKSSTGLGGSGTSREGIISEFRAPWGATKKFLKITGGEIISDDEGRNQFYSYNKGGGYIDFLSSERGNTWENVDINTTIDPYTKPFIADSSKPEYIGSNSMPVSNIPIGASLRFAGINEQGNSIKYPSSFGGSKVLSSAVVIDTNGVASVSGVEGSIEENKNIVEITNNGGLTWENANISTNIFDPIVPISKLSNPIDLFSFPTGSTDYYALLNLPSSSFTDSYSKSGGVNWNIKNLNNVYNPGTLTSNINPSFENFQYRQSSTLTQEQLNEISLETEENQYNPGSKIVNFQNRITSISPSYTFKTNYTDLDQIIDNDTGFNRNSYRSPGLKSSEGKVIDRVNAQHLYKSNDATLTNIESGESGSTMTEDLIPFRIGALNVSSELAFASDIEKEYIHFRAYIDSFSDSYSSEWNSTKYMGRGEKFYSYGGFDRSISLAFTVAAQSKQELAIQYQKLNFLVSNLAPTYTKAGYMSGPLVELTVGDWCTNLTGFISSITLDIPEESPWEISEVNQKLPHICKVSGFNFTPIEDFRPEKQINDYESNGDIKQYGNQTFIYPSQENFI
tara:strand:+ start:7217 stop:9598 length:2382 start_codon:yes stop_codon:yes gene_type:complete